jgi:hypothetical protein
MLLKELLCLPVGTRVFGNIDAAVTLPGVIARFPDGSPFIRWDDGCRTIPLGNGEYDDYIATRTRLAPLRPIARGLTESIEQNACISGCAPYHPAEMTR